MLDYTIVRVWLGYGQFRVGISIKYDHPIPEIHQECDGIGHIVTVRVRKGC